ncbi:hypothetical protein [Salinarchaeum laminariae]|uniref:hypothetical protein n=1 Tax=Salinarchaeum laminariae TaxID=869888 RepID=UPI0020C01D4E|nr:hypothetical protein [Salinarchaeum laminariae]
MIALTVRDGDSVRNELVHLGHASATVDDVPMDQPPQTELPKNLTLHVGNDDALLERADSSPQLTELVLAPVKLHRRNIQRRLRESQTPKDGLQFADPPEVGKRVLDAADLPTRTTDRIDRLSMIRSVLSDEDVSITTSAVRSDPQTLEQTRTELEAVTGFHPERVEILEGFASSLPAPIDADATEILSAATDVERALRKRASKSISDVEIVRRAAREILATNGRAWQEAFPEVDSVSLVGVSSIPAAHIDLLHAVLNSVSVSAHIHFRRGTGSYLSRRVPQLLDVAEPGAVVFES